MHNHQIFRCNHLNPSPPARVLAIASGKGGVGKSCIATNLSAALAKTGHRTALLDADTGLSNADILLGLSPAYNLSHMLAGKCSLTDIIISNQDGLLVIPAASGLQEMADLSVQQQASIIRGLSVLDNHVDYLVIDMPAGISKSTINFVRAAQEIVIVVCDEPASLADAFAFIKLFATKYKVFHFHIICNMVSSLDNGVTLFTRLCKIAENQVDISLCHLGSIEYDWNLKQAVQHQQAVVSRYPNAVSSQQIFEICKVVGSWSHPSQPRGCLEFFLERLIRFTCTDGQSVLTNTA